jgi:hypothetical protein
MSTKITIEEVREWRHKGYEYGKYSYTDLCDFALAQHEELERLRTQLAEAQTEISSLNKVLSDPVTLAENDVLRNALAERDAQLAECTQVLDKYADPNHWGYVDPSGCPKGMGRYIDYCDIGPIAAVEALEQMPTSAKHNAEILRAAESLSYSLRDIRSEELYKTEYDEVVDLVKAVRAKKAGE